MKRMTKISLTVLLACIVAFSAVFAVFADTIFTDGSGFSYTQLYSDYASICGWEGDSDTLRIPLKVNDSYVKEISSWAFSDRSDLSAVVFDRADYLDTIGMMAFSSCTGLSGGVNIPSQVTDIGMSAFQGCSGFDTLYYNTRADIPEQCFYSCSSLETVYLADGVKNIGRLAFADCGSLSYIRITDSVEYISPIAFKGCDNLTVYCYTDSYAHQYAADNGISFVLIDAPAPTEPPTQEPTSEPTETPTEITGYYIGDSDGNGELESIDATLIQRHLVELPIPVSEDVLIHGDVDEDEELTVLDVTFIMRYLAIIPTPYPIGEYVEI